MLDDVCDCDYDNDERIRTENTYWNTEHLKSVWCQLLTAASRIVSCALLRYFTKTFMDMHRIMLRSRSKCCARIHTHSNTLKYFGSLEHIFTRFHSRYRMGATKWTWPIEWFFFRSTVGFSIVSTTNLLLIYMCFVFFIFDYWYLLSTFFKEKLHGTLAWQGHQRICIHFTAYDTVHWPFIRQCGSVFHAQWAKGGKSIGTFEIGKSSIIVGTGCIDLQQRCPYLLVMMFGRVHTFWTSIQISLPKHLHQFERCKCG